MQKTIPALSFLLLAASVTLLALAQVGWLGGGSGADEPKDGQVAKQDETLRDGETKDAEGEEPDLHDSLAKILHELEQLRMEGGKKEMEKLKIIDERVDELASQIWEFERQMQRNLHTLQANVMRRLSELNVSGSGTKEPKDPREMIEELAAENVKMNVSSRYIEIGGQLVVPRRPLEAVAACDGGPLHEALLRTDAKPSAIRRALMALGAKPGRSYDYETGKGPSGAPLHIYITWEGLKKPWRLEDVLLDSRTDITMENPTWVFSGSEYSTDFNSGKEFYIPDASRVAISLAHKFSHSAVISCKHPDAGNEAIWVPATPLFPSVEELDVTLTIALQSIPQLERERIRRVGSNGEEKK